MDAAQRATDPSRSDRPIFVVGTPRSGTTLLAAMLGAHPQIDCGPETLLLSKLEAADRRAILDPATWPGPAADFVLGLSLKATPVVEAYGVEPDAVRAYLASGPPSVAALLESLTVTRARLNGKPRWAEKTPRHALLLPLIRREWPDAIVIRVVRDPRDVALSLSKVPFGSQTLAADVLGVGSQMRRGDTLAARDAGTIEVRYEDLLSDPSRVLRRVCTVIDVPYDPSMVERRDSAAAIAAPHEWWKAKAAEPIDRSRAGAWRTEMPAEVQRFANLQLRDVLRAHGYPDAEEPARQVAIVPLTDRFPVNHDQLLLALAAKGTSVMDPFPRTPAELAAADDLVLWGVPGQIPVDLGRTAGERTLGLVAFAGLLVRRRLAGRPAIWVRRKTPWPERPDLPVQAVASRLLKVLARTVPYRAFGAALGVAGDVTGSPDE
jgi:hypothetical protein